MCLCHAGAAVTSRASIANYWGSGGLSAAAHGILVGTAVLAKFLSCVLATANQAHSQDHGSDN